MKVIQSARAFLEMLGRPQLGFPDFQGMGCSPRAMPGLSNPMGSAMPSAIRARGQIKP